MVYSVKVDFKKKTCVQSHFIVFFRISRKNDYIFLRVQKSGLLLFLRYRRQRTCVDTVSGYNRRARQIRRIFKDAFVRYITYNNILYILLGTACPDRHMTRRQVNTRCLFFFYSKSSLFRKPRETVRHDIVFFIETLFF